MPGIFQSVTTASKRCSSTARSAASPLEACVHSYPARPSAVATTADIRASSSTIKMRGFIRNASGGKAHEEARARALRVRDHFDLAVVGLDDPARDRETEPDADRAGGEE